MRRCVLLAVRLALLLSAVLPSAHLAAQQRFVPPAKTGPAIIGVMSGGVDGTYIRIAADLATVLDDPAQLRVLPIIGKGSVQNIDDILHVRGVDIGIVQSDALAYIRQHDLLPGAERSIDYIAKLYDEEVHVLAAARITSLSQLAGSKVNEDLQGSGTALTAAAMFDSLGIAVQAVHDDQATALDKLRRGEIDALIYVAGKPARLFSGLPAGTGLHLLAIPLTAGLVESYLPSRFDAADYPGLLANGETVETIAVGAVMAVFNWPRNTDRYVAGARFVDALFGNIDRFRQAPRHPKWREVNLAAQVPGWKRFPPAELWLNRRTTEASRP